MNSAPGTDLPSQSNPQEDAWLKNWLCPALLFYILLVLPILFLFREEEYVLPSALRVSSQSHKSTSAIHGSLSLHHPPRATISESLHRIAAFLTELIIKWKSKDSLVLINFLITATRASDCEFIQTKHDLAILIYGPLLPVDGWFPWPIVHRLSSSFSPPPFLVGSQQRRRADAISDQRLSWIDIECGQSY